MTINKVCGSGLKAVMLADQGIRTGDIDIAVAGGMESASNTPHLLQKVREGLRLGNSEVVDSMISDGLWCAFEQCHMGSAGEVVAEHYHVGREAQDDYAARSHQKAARASDEGLFKDEILPISIPQRKGPPQIIDRDEPIRADTTAEALGKLKPAFKEGGSVTAGNAPGVNDGASALARHGRGTREGAQSRAARAHRGARHQRAGPEVRADDAGRSGPASRGEGGLVARRGGSVRDQRSVFGAGGRGAQGARDRSGKVNVNGGAVALGHAIGSSGARVLTTLLYALKQRNLERGIASAVPRRRQRRGDGCRTRLIAINAETAEPAEKLGSACSASSASNVVQ